MGAGLELYHLQMDHMPDYQLSHLPIMEMSWLQAAASWKFQTTLRMTGH